MNVYNALLHMPPRARVPRIEFWSNPSDWPDDAGGYVFAARALLEYGRHLLADEWTDASPQTELHFTLPASLSVHMDFLELRRGVALLHSKHTKYSRRIVSAPNGLLALGESVFYPRGDGQRSPAARVSNFPSVEEWDEAYDISEGLAKNSWMEFRPFFKVAMRLAWFCRENHLQSALRALPGGGYSPLDWSDWNYESACWRFELCKMAALPSSDLDADSPMQWIFFERESFQKLLSSDVPPIAEVTDQREIAEKLESAKLSRAPAGRKRKSQLDLAMGGLVLMVHEDGIEKRLSHRKLSEDLSAWVMEQYGEEISPDTIRAHLPDWLRPLHNSSGD